MIEERERGRRNQFLDEKRRGGNKERKERKKKEQVMNQFFNIKEEIKKRGRKEEVLESKRKNKSIPLFLSSIIMKKFSLKFTRTQ